MFGRYMAWWNACAGAIIMPNWRLFEPLLARALQNADVPITSSCMCRTKVNSHSRVQCPRVIAAHEVTAKLRIADFGEGHRFAEFLRRAAPYVAANAIASSRADRNADLRTDRPFRALGRRQPRKQAAAESKFGALDIEIDMSTLVHLRDDGTRACTRFARFAKAKVFGSNKQINWRGT